jgi:hypothetical protein
MTFRRVLWWWGGSHKDLGRRRCARVRLTHQRTRGDGAAERRSGAGQQRDDGGGIAVGCMQSHSGKHYLYV